MTTGPDNYDDDDHGLAGIASSESDFVTTDMDDCADDELIDLDAFAEFFGDDDKQPPNSGTSDGRAVATTISKEGSPSEETLGGDSIPEVSVDAVKEKLGRELNFDEYFEALFEELDDGDPIDPYVRQDDDDIPTYRQADREVLGWVNARFGVNLSCWDNRPDRYQRWISSTDDALTINMDMLDHHRVELTDQGYMGRRIMFGSFNSPRVQLYCPVLFGSLYLHFAPREYSRWRYQVTPEQLPEKYRLDYESVMRLDTARAQVLIAQSATWIPTILHSALGPWLMDPSRRPVRSDRPGAVEWLIANIIAPAWGGIIPTKAAAMAEDMVARSIGADKLGEIKQWWRRFVQLQNPTVAEALFFGSQLADITETITINSVDTGGDSGSLDCGRAAGFVIKTLVQGIDEALDDLSSLWPPYPYRSEKYPKHSRWSGEDGLATRVDDQGYPAHHRIDYREVTDKDRVMVRRISSQLDKAKVRQPGVDLLPTATPGGRLDTRQLVQSESQRLRGVQVTATPWKRVRADQKARPDITAALVCDFSVSMGPWIRHLGPLCWSLAHATRATGGAVAAAGFSDGAWPLIRPATATTDTVPEIVGTGSNTRGCKEALDVAVRDSGLLTASGARIVMVITDGGIPDDGGERPGIQKAVKELSARGIQVYWVIVSNSNVDTWSPSGVHHLRLSSPEEFATEITSTIIRHLEAFGSA